MADVAKAAGVSPMTVSRAFKRDASVSEPTRRTILETAERLGYIFDSMAAGLSSRRTGFVAVTIPSINNANFADTVRGLVENLRGTGLQILLGYTDYDMHEEERLVEQFLTRRPEAMVLTGGKHTPRCRHLLEKAGIPIIETWDLPADPIDQVVGFSNADAGRMMVRHFVERGCSRLGFIGGDTTRDTRGLDRRRGFVDGLNEAGLDATRLVAAGLPPVSMREGAQALRDLIERWPDTEAVMCVSDLSAFGALTECLRMGIAVPDRLAVAGFGAYEVSELSVPSITTIDVHAERIGAATAACILGRLDDDAPPVVPEPLVPRLLFRQSTGGTGA